ncbi:hypothetical protein GJ496_007758 [Pomphorhynchus laevis]|nr:hypothetical protein GJ496_007758 [Pomphorhynchus laevis]
MRFAIPMVWRKPNNHGNDCYFRAQNLKNINRNSFQTLIYPNLTSAMRPVLHSEEQPVPNFSALHHLSSSSSDQDFSLKDVDKDEEFSDETTPKLFSQIELNDLVRDLTLPKNSAELLTSRLKENNLLENDVYVPKMSGRCDDGGLLLVSKTRHHCLSTLSVRKES